MSPYADSSFLVRVYTPHPDSRIAIAWMQRTSAPVPYTPLHRHEVRTAIRLRVFRGELTTAERNQALREIDSDLQDNILAHTPVPWTEAFRESEQLGATHCETLGVRSADLLHVGLALALDATDFLTFDARQATLAKAAGLKLYPQTD